MALFPLPSLPPFFSHFTHEKYVQTVVNHSTRCISHAKTHFGAAESQKDHLMDFPLSSSAQWSHISPMITPLLQHLQSGSQKKLQCIIDYAMYTRCTQKDLMWSLLEGRNGPLFSSSTRASTPAL
jgi:hypothetical protein